MSTEAVFTSSDTTSILITPVAQVAKAKKSGSPDSHRDYNEQCERFSRGQPMCWDDEKHNNTKAGDIFGFYKGGDCVEIHRVEAVQDPVASPIVMERQRGPTGPQRAHVVVPYLHYSVERLDQFRLARQRPAPRNPARGQR